MKGKNNNKKSDFKIIHSVVVYDDIHKELETELLDLEQIEMYMVECSRNNIEIPDVLVIVHKDKIDNINNLLKQRLHSDK